MHFDKTVNLFHSYAVKRKASPIISVLESDHERTEVFCIFHEHFIPAVNSSCINMALKY
mgnify:CR=1 FL=1